MLENLNFSCVYKIDFCSIRANMNFSRVIVRTNFGYSSLKYPKKFSYQQESLRFH